MNMGRFLTINAAKYPQKEAIIFNNKRFTYEEFNKRVNRLANAFLDMGFKKGDKISTYLPNCNEHIETLWALAKIGVGTVPINPGLLGKEMGYYVVQSDSDGIVFHETLEHQVVKVKDKLQHVRSSAFIMVGENVPNYGVAYEKLLDQSSDAEPTTRIKYEIDENDLYYIGYTSGTTGVPKGAYVTHAQRMYHNLALIIEHNYKEDDIALCAGPLFHAAPKCYTDEVQLMSGGTVVIMPRFHPFEALAFIEKEKITSTFMAPTMLNFILNLPEEEKTRYNTDSLRTLITGGSALPTRTKENILKIFKNAGLHLFYGSTETGIVTNLRPHDQLTTTGTSGKTVFGIDMKVMDEKGMELPRGEIGELYSRGIWTFTGYYKMPEATKEVFREGWLTVGDIARIDEEGFVYILDRKSDMILRGAENIYPVGIENVIMSNPAVMEVAVIGVPDEVYGESVKAVVVLKKGAALTEKELISFCKENMAKYLVPSSVDFVDSLPKSPAGKILKKEIRAKYLK